MKAITDIQELTPEIVREFISRIDVYASYRENKQRHQRIDIYYHGIGYVFIPEPEEVEEMFQEHLRDRKQYMKEKEGSSSCKKLELPSNALGARGIWSENFRSSSRKRTNVRREGENGNRK